MKEKKVRTFEKIKNKNPVNPVDEELLPGLNGHAGGDVRIQERSCF